MTKEPEIIEGNGHEILYEYLRYYKHRPDSAVVKDFVDLLDSNPTICG